MRIRNVTVTALALSLAAFISAPMVLPQPAAADHHKTEKKESAKADIVDTAVAAGQFKTLAAALEAGGLVEALKGEGPFTVLAPTDKAFAKLPEGTVESLLQPENKEKLIAVLKYHVIPAKAMSKDVAALSEAETLLDKKKVQIRVVEGKVMINDATVTKADIVATNGVIHVIDTVLLP